MINVALLLCRGLGLALLQYGQWRNYCRIVYVKRRYINFGISGDPRVNENAGLGMIHIVLIRWHNHVEEQLHHLNGHWQGEQLFQETRRIMVATLEHITFNEWLPLLLGPTI